MAPQCPRPRGWSRSVGSPTCQSSPPAATLETQMADLAARGSLPVKSPTTASGSIGIGDCLNGKAVDTAYSENYMVNMVRPAFGMGFGGLMGKASDAALAHHHFVKPAVEVPELGGMPSRALSPSDLGPPVLRRAVAARDEHFTLCPSVAPTPRLRSVSKPVLYGSFVVRPAQIFMPSANSANDFARVRNGGKPLQARAQLADIGQGLLHTASAPALLSGGSASSAASIEAGSLAPRTPRSNRGLVRRVSKVFCGVALADRLPPPQPPPCPWRCGGGNSSNAPSPVSSEPGKLKKSLSNKRVSFSEQQADEPTSRLDFYGDNMPSPALKRSKKLLESLRDLRRVNVEDSPSNATCGFEAAGSFSAEEKAAALLHTTLGELFDNESSVRALEAQLQDASRGVVGLGGARHPTAIISARTLAVVRRKAALLHDVEARVVAFQSAHSRREELIPQVLRGESAESQADLMGIRKFITQYSHKSASGSPVDADKSDFDAFACSFKLPARHQQLERLRALSDDISQWWAEASLRVAEEGANYEQIRRMFGVSMGAGADSEHPYILRATRILNDRLADKVLKDAEDSQRRDTEAFERSSVPLVGPASSAADTIEQAILQAIAQGVPPSDPRLTKVKAICKTLREADGQRKRLAARQKRLGARAADLAHAFESEAYPDLRP